MRWRTPVAGMALLVYLLIYCLLVMAVGQYLTGLNAWIQAVFYLVVGVVWIFPTVWLFRWSAKDPGTELSNITIEQRARSMSDSAPNE